MGCCGGRLGRTLVSLGACAAGAAASSSSSSSGPALNVFGRPMESCYLGASGPSDTCLFSDTLEDSQLCVQPPAQYVSPFCLGATQFGKYLAAQPPGSDPASGLRGWCASVPEAILSADFMHANVVVHVVENFLDVAEHLCRSCLVEGSLGPVASEGCWGLLKGTSTATTTSTVDTTTVLPWKPPDLATFGAVVKAITDSPYLPLLAGILGALALGAYCTVVALRAMERQAAFSSDSDDTGSPSARSARSARRGGVDGSPKGSEANVYFVGAWESLGQTHYITATDIHWHDRKVTRIMPAGPTAFEIVGGGGVGNQACLDRDGQSLLWGDGSVWLRAEERSPLLPKGRRR